MKIEKLPSGSYRIRKTYKGKTYTVITDYKPTQKEALKLISDKLDEGPVSIAHLTFEDAAAKYIESKEAILSPSTVVGYEKIVRTLSSKFKAFLISDITQLEVQTEINNYSKTRSAKSVRNAHGFISAVLKVFKPSLTLNTTLPKKRKEIPYIPTDEDVKKILDYIKGTPVEIPLLLACYGLRRSEICALSIDDLSGNILTVNKALVYSKNKEWVLKQMPKTEDGARKIFLPDEIADMIREQGYIYKGSPHRIYKRLSQAEKDLELQHFSLHKLRHYFASRMHSLGIPSSYIEQMGGWKTDATLKAVYEHAMRDQIDDMQKFGSEYLKELLF